MSLGIISVSFEVYFGCSYSSAILPVWLDYEFFQTVHLVVNVALHQIDMFEKSHDQKCVLSLVSTLKIGS